MRAFRVTQQIAVCAILFVAFSILLKGFLTPTIC